MKIKKKSAPKPEPEEQLIEEVPSAEESQKEYDLNEMQRTLAECENRITAINATVEEAVLAKVREITETVRSHIHEMEEQVFVRLVDFFQMMPAFEVTKVSKADVGHNNANNPYQQFRKLASQGWSWVGNFYDEQAKERYDLFMRRKSAPLTLEKLMEVYEEYRAKSEESINDTLKGLRKEDKKKTSDILKRLGYDSQGNKLPEKKLKAPKAPVVSTALVRSPVKAAKLKLTLGKSKNQK